MKIRHTTAFIFSGITWFGIGLFLLSKGLNFLVQSNQEGSLIIVAGALMAGFLKGRFVLAKTVKKMESRITAKPNPFLIKELYPASYYILIASMVLLGLTMRFLPIDITIRGGVDVAIGSALMNGAFLYFRQAMAFAAKKG